MDIANTLGKKPDSSVKEILNDIEKLIVLGKLKNDKEILLKYVKDNY